MDGLVSVTAFASETGCGRGGREIWAMVGVKVGEGEDNVCQLSRFKMGGMDDMMGVEEMEFDGIV
ncbi:hypothetical protein ACLOJK_027690 [Asimina triloba]